MLRPTWAGLAPAETRQLPWSTDRIPIAQLELTGRARNRVIAKGVVSTFGPQVEREHPELRRSG